MCPASKLNIINRRYQYVYHILIKKNSCVAIYKATFFKILNVILYFQKYSVQCFLEKCNTMYLVYFTIDILWLNKNKKK